MKKINVVIIGIGHDHCHDVFSCITSKDSSFNLLGIVFDKNDNGNYLKWQNDYDKYPHFDIEQALSLDNLDAVFIETDDLELSKYALMFAKKGVPIHMDKPGGQDKDEFDELISTCKRNNSILHLGYMYRYNPAVIELLKIVKSGELGKIYTVEAQMNISHPVSKRQWMRNFKGGMMNFLGCHLIDLVTLILGKPDSVTSFNTKSQNDVGEDIAFAILKYGENISTVNASSVEIDGFSRRHLVVTAEKACIEICPMEKYIDGAFYSTVKYKAYEETSLIKPGEITYGPFDRYKNMLEEFASIIRKEISNPYSLEHEKLVHDVLLSACETYGKEIKLWKQL